MDGEHYEDENEDENEEDLLARSVDKVDGMDEVGLGGGSFLLFIRAGGWHDGGHITINSLCVYCSAP